MDRDKDLFDLLPGTAGVMLRFNGRIMQGKLGKLKLDSVPQMLVGLYVCICVACKVCVCLSDNVCTCVYVSVKRLRGLSYCEMILWSLLKTAKY